MQQEKIFVIGHRNPDTDSVCSAIAYARLRRNQGLENIQAARAGHVNRQTEFVLNQLKCPLPTLLLDVSPRVRDIVTDRVITIDAEAPLAHAVELFHHHRIRLLPVIDEDRRPVSLLILKNLAERFLVPSRESEIRKVLASPGSIARCLKASVLHMVSEHSVEELKFYVGAMASGTFHQKMAGLDPRTMILITGDRENIQREGVEMGVRVLIVTGGLPVSPAILARGRNRGVTILSTPYDTANSAWLTRLSTPVKALSGREFLTVSLEERVEDLRRKLVRSKEPGGVVLDVQGRVAGVVTKSNLLAPSPVKLVLVDHNELSQAVTGADKVDILEVVDHHRLGNFHTEEPIRFINQPLGSTCSVVASLYRQAGIDPDPQTAGLMLAGLLSDTVLLKSPTTTETDLTTAGWLGELAGIEPMDFGRQIFASGSSLGDFATPRDLVLADFKEYEIDQRQFGIGQVEVANFHEFHELRDSIEEALKKVMEEKGLDMAGLLVTDILQETSLLLAVGDPELPYIIGYPHLQDSLYQASGVLSRKKQLIPHLLRVLRPSMGE